MLARLIPRWLRRGAATPRPTATAGASGGDRIFIRAGANGALVAAGVVSESTVKSTVGGSVPELDALAMSVLFSKSRSRLVVASGDLREIIDIRKLCVNIGRAKTTEPPIDVVIAHEQVSAYHAQIYYSKGFYWIADAGSRNGTELSGERLTAGKERARQLHGDARIKLGSVDVLFVVDCDRTGASTPAQRYLSALDLLVDDGTVDKASVRLVTQKAASQNRHVGEILLVDGLVTVGQWVDAFERVPVVQIARQFGARSRRSVLAVMLLVGAIAGITIAALVPMVRGWVAGRPGG